MGSSNRILILNERDPLHPRAGGAEVHLAELAPHLAHRGYELTQFACSFPGSRPKETQGALQVRRIGPLPFYYARAAWLCAQETRRGRYDLVIEILAKFPFYSPLYSSAPVLAICHHLFGRTAFLQIAWPIATAVYLAEKTIPTFYRRPAFIVGSESTRTDLVERGISGDRIRLIPYGARPTAPSSGVLKSRPSHHARICFVGRLEPYKQVDILLRAAALLVGRIPDLEVFVIGRGSERERLERIAQEIGIGDITRFTGYVSDEERDALLRETRVCVFPSVREGWGLTVIEANACGVPVVATHAPGLRDSVVDGETGFLVADGNIEGFAERIAQLLTDDALATRMSTAAQDWAKRFDWKHAADALDESLQRLKGAI
ncbi:glycosyltransferase family 4 protein [Myxococcota bacterium]|nr:glycosyltransferase family 4 protein [Myxococcota bacterium]